MNLACLFGRHEFRLVGEWRAKRYVTPNGKGLLPYGYCSDIAGNTYCGGGIKVECPRCGKREYAKFVMPSTENAWKDRIDIRPEWRLVVQGHTRLYDVVDGPTHAEILEEIGR